ncbi:MAG: transcriptional repressor [Bacteroidales bacterium]|nr:transcriptional repressor [Bacteroidales bacterium]
MMREKTILQYLEEHGIRPSVQRIAIAEYLIKHKTHPTADEIYEALSPQIPTLSKTTVYNTLKLFADCGVASLLNIDEKNIRFDGEITPHAHLKCKKCGKIKDVMGCRFPRYFRKDFYVMETQVFFVGFCEECMSNITHNSNN